MDALPQALVTSELAHDVVVVGASAGGLTALRILMTGLSGEFPLPVVAMLHLPPGAEPEVALLKLPLPVERLQQGQRLAAGTLWICPPRAFVELLPDNSCMVFDNPGGAIARPIDRLLMSTARSFGQRAIGVILTGMGRDGAAGARELHAAGGRVLVQAPAGAEHAEMPDAAIAAGAADLVVPLDLMGEVVSEFARGAPRTRARSELRAIAVAFGERGEVAAAARDVDWQTTPLGAVLAWPDMFKQLTRETLDAAGASAVWWGAQHVEIYNDAWRPFLGDQHPLALGRPARQNWQNPQQDWDRMGLLAERVMSTGQAVAGAPLRFLVCRAHALEEVFASFGCAPLRDLSGRVQGLRCTLWETTRDVVAQRRMQLLQAMGTRMSRAANRHQACALAADTLADHPAEAAFALVYLVDSPQRQATLACSAGLAAGSPAAPHLVHLNGTGGGWPLEAVLKDAAQPPRGDTGERPPAAVVMVDHLEERFPGLAATLEPGRERATQAVLIALYATSQVSPQGVVILGLPPYRPYDAAHAAFVELLGQQLATGLSEARAREQERERLDQLAALDRAKTDFFSNVSHEFRTPLTLLLAPLEELAREREALPTHIATELDTAVRNARRLLRLVNSLLDFSQIEVRGRQALVTPTDLGLLTADIASAFRSAIESAGLALRVDIAPEMQHVPVNGPMWEQIVSNLLSNALKFTFDGAVIVRLKVLRMHAELEVSDSGIGIPPNELRDIFKRFHRVRGARARTAEGSGIGLAVVQDLVQRMGGQLTVRSTEGMGSTFTIWMPLKAQPARIGGGDGRAVPEVHRRLAADLASEASRWSERTAPDDVIEDMVEPGPAVVNGLHAPRARLLVADDNADLREYLRRLLGTQWEVQLAAHGEQALALAREQPPDLVLADVTMPGMDGFQLLRRLREDPRLARLPFVLLTARASEEAAIEGLRAGADDYIAKPFSPRELVARVRAAVDRARADAALRVSESKYRQLFERMNQAYALNELVRDAEGRPVDHKLLEANPALERMLGVSLDDVRGRPVSGWMPGLEPWWLETFDRVIRAGEPERVEHAVAPLGRWFQVNLYPDEGDRFFSLAEDITARKRAEFQLRDSEERQAFLLRLSDVLAPLAEPSEIMGEASRLLGKRLAVGWCYYNEFDRRGTVAIILRDFARPGLPSMVGEHELSGVPDFIDWVKSGHAFDMPDFATCPLFTPEFAARYTAVGMLSALGMPLVKEGQLISVFMVADTRIRVWTDTETLLLRDVAERTWAAVERARAEEALRQSDDRHREELERTVRERTAQLQANRDLLQATMDASTDMIQVFESVRDPSGEIIDFRWIVNNHTSESFYGDVLGQSLLQNNPGVVAEGIFETFKRVAETGESDQSERHYVHEQFDSWYLQTTVKLGDGVATTTKDIGAWKAAQAQVMQLEQDVAQTRLREREAQLQAVFRGALEESEQRLRSAAEVGKLGLWDWNVLTGEIFWSDEHFRMQGYAVGEVAPSYEAWVARIHPDDRSTTEAALEEAMAQHAEYVHEFRVLHPNGSVYRLRARGRFLYDGDGKPVRMIGAMVDVTGRAPAAAR